MDKTAYIQAMAKHLPPSGANLRLLDIGGRVGAILAELRGDLDITAETPNSGLLPDTMDAVAAFDHTFDSDFFNHALTTLRPGGRFIGIDPDGSVDQSWVARLEQAGFTRILVEAALESGGVLIRGEKPHTERRTIDRIKQVADGDSIFPGRYVYLLIRQMPNKPVWALKEGEKVEWQAVALTGEDGPVFMAFSSLPKAVAFMQPAVINGQIKDINKVAKFSREIAQDWSLLVNPSIEILAGRPVTLVAVDPDTAEKPDE